jgi:putative transposase
MAEFPHIKKQFWGRHLWARGYFCCSSGNVTDEVIAKYIADQTSIEMRISEWMVKAIYFLKPAECRNYPAGLRPEEDLQSAIVATAFLAVVCHFKTVKLTLGSLTANRVAWEMSQKKIRATLVAALL